MCACVCVRVSLRAVVPLLSALYACNLYVRISSSSLLSVVICGVIMVLFMR